MGKDEHAQRVGIILEDDAIISDAEADGVYASQLLYVALAA